MRSVSISLFFFFNDPATTEIYTLSLHDALPICSHRGARRSDAIPRPDARRPRTRRGRHLRSDQSRVRAAVMPGSRGEMTMTMTRTERLLSALEVEITNVSKLEHVLARTRVVLREHATRLRPGEDPEMVMTGLRL